MAKEKDLVEFSSPLHPVEVEESSEFYQYIYNKILEERRKEVHELLKHIFGKKYRQLLDSSDKDGQIICVNKIQYKGVSPWFYIDPRKMKFFRDKAESLFDEYCETLNMLVHADSMTEAHECSLECEKYIDEIFACVNDEIKEHLKISKSDILSAIRYQDFGAFYYDNNQPYEKMYNKLYDKEGDVYGNTPLKKH